MIRISFAIIFLVLGLFVPTWLFLTALFAGAFFFKNFWEAIGITVIINAVFVYNNADFQASYVVFGIVVYIISHFIHTRTRFKTTLQE